MIFDNIQIDKHIKRMAKIKAHKDFGMARGTSYQERVEINGVEHFIRLENDGDVTIRVPYTKNNFPENKEVENLENELDRHLKTLQDFIQEREKVRRLIRSGYEVPENDLMKWNVSIADYIDLLYKIMILKKKCV